MIQTACADHLSTFDQWHRHLALVTSQTGRYLDKAQSNMHSTFLSNYSLQCVRLPWGEVLVIRPAIEPTS